MCGLGKLCMWVELIKFGSNPVHFVLGLRHSCRTSQRRWSRRAIPDKHGRCQNCGCWLRRLILSILGWLQQNDVKMMSLYRRPACSHIRWERSASQSTASNASVDLIGHNKSSEYLICPWFSQRTDQSLYWYSDQFYSLTGLRWRLATSDTLPISVLHSALPSALQ